MLLAVGTIFSASSSGGETPANNSPPSLHPPVAAGEWGNKKAPVSILSLGRKETEAKLRGTTLFAVPSKKRPLRHIDRYTGMCRKPSLKNDFIPNTSTVNPFNVRCGNGHQPASLTDPEPFSDVFRLLFPGDFPNSSADCLAPSDSSLYRVRIRTLPVHNICFV